jgi:hypothetical protein
MTPEQQRIEKLEQHLLNLQVRLLVQTAEIQSVLTLLRPEDSAQAEKWDAAFLAGRQARLQILLALTQDSDPALAARLRALLSAPGLSFPVD